MAKNSKWAEKGVLISVWNSDQSEDVEGTLPNGTQVRLTVGWFSSYQHAYYEALVRQTFRYAQEKYGLGPLELVEAENEAGISQQAYKFQSLWQRCWMLAGVRSVQVKPLNGVWFDDELPDEWQGIETFVYAIPKELHDAWAAAVIRLNPQVFSAPQDDDAKKNEPTTEPILIEESA